MTERAIDEPHRVASPLELLFDLTFVVAIASITAQLAHGIAEGHAVEQVTPFLQVFFAIWWAWMNFTWFASSYDTDDVPYRLLTMLQMAGVLVLAAGVPAAFAESDYRAVTLGYLVMRAALVAQWLRAGIEHSESRRTAFRYAAGISMLQVGWLLRLVLAETGVLPESSLLPVFLCLVALELAVPRWAERTRPTSWHAHHIAERYGLLLIILLGESVLAAFTGLQAAFAAGGLKWSLVTVAVAALVLLFALWWLYFLQPSASGLAKNREQSFLWGYGHYGIFAAAAAVGAGLEVAVEGAGHHLDVSAVGVGFAVAVPVAVFLVLLWAVHVPLVDRPVIRPVLTVGAAGGILLLPPMAGFLGLTAVVVLIAAGCALLIATTILTSSRSPAGTSPDPPGP
jgi:low temperature requirement protein LtrA